MRKKTTARVSRPDDVTQNEAEIRFLKSLAKCLSENRIPCYGLDGSGISTVMPTMPPRLAERMAISGTYGGAAVLA